jgi:hypothetical protein
MSYIVSDQKASTGGVCPSYRHCDNYSASVKSRWQCTMSVWASRHRTHVSPLREKPEWALKSLIGLRAVSGAVALVCVSCFELSASGLRSAFRFWGSYGSSLIFQSFGFCATDIAALIPRHAGFIAIAVGLMQPSIMYAG